MKRFLLFYVLLFSLFPCMYPNHNKDTKEIDYNWIKISPDNIWLGIENLNGQYYLILDIISDAMLVFNNDSPLIIKSADNLITQFLPLGYYESSIGGGQIDDYGETQMGIKVIYNGNLDFLKNNRLSLLTINFIGGEISLNLSSEISSKINNKVSTLLKNEVFTPSYSHLKLKSYDIFYYKKNKKDSKWELIRTETRVLSKKELNDLKETWVSQTDSTYEYKCKIKKRNSYIY